MQINAAVAREADKGFALETVELDNPGPGELLVRLVATGICHTDLAILERLIPLPLPIVLGHEGAGIVERVGPEVEGFEAGDRVVLTFDSCGHCPACRAHRPSYCEQYPLRNLSTRRPDGSASISDASGSTLGSCFFGQSSFATHALTRPRNSVKVRPDAPLELLGPLGCGLSTGAGAVMNAIKPAPDSSLLVVGAGAVGMAAVMAAKVLGVQRIVAVDRVASRLALARELGATQTIDTSSDDLGQALKAGGGIHNVIDTSGVPPLIAASLEAIQGPGTCILLGVSRDIELKLNILPLIRGATVRGALHGDCDPHTLIPQLIDLYMEGRFPLDRLSGFYDLPDINQGVADSKSGKTIKPIVRMPT